MNKKQFNIMSTILNNEHITKFNQDGAILIKGKFDNHWIKILKQGFEKAKSNPSPRFTNHTKSPNSPKYLEDFWTWNLHKELKILYLIRLLQKCI
jgi:hypothetical protein